VDATLRELVEQPGIDGAETKLSSFGALLRTFDGVEDEANLGARKIRVDE
jgi:hypothetical protein